MVARKKKKPARQKDPATMSDKPVESGDVQVEPPTVSPKRRTDAPRSRWDPTLAKKSPVAGDGGEADETVLSPESASQFQSGKDPGLAAEGEPDPNLGSEAPDPSEADERAREFETGPLVDAAGKFVRISELVTFTDDDGDPCFSATVVAALRRAQSEPRLISREGYAVVDAWAYLRAAILQGVQEVDEKRDRRTAHNFLADWFDSTDFSLDELGEDRVIRLSTQGGMVQTPAGPFDSDRASATAVAHLELTEIIAKAAHLVRQTDTKQTRIDARHLLTGRCQSKLT